MRAQRTILIGTLAGLAFAAVGCVKSEIKPVAKASDGEPVEVTRAASPTAPGDWAVLRVGGDPEHELREQPGETKSGDEVTYYSAGTARLSAKLAEGYPRPTPPGAIELKVYNSYRQAVIETERGQGSAFFPLFRHIQSRDIAMTSPVVMTGAMAGEDQRESSMAFLYASPDLGPTGEAERDITVEDTPRTTVLSIAFQGRERGERLAEMKSSLLDWLDSQEGDDGRWEVSGTPRLIGYNGPDQAVSRRWWEYQIPVAWGRIAPY